MIIAVIETDQGKLAEASRQMLTFARDLAGRFEVPLAAVTFETVDGELAREAGAFGAASLIQVSHEALYAYAPAALARAVVQLIEAKKPAAVLAASTDRGNEILAHAAAMADLPMASNCAEVRGIDPFEITRLRWGGSLLEEARLEKEPKLMRRPRRRRLPRRRSSPPRWKKRTCGSGSPDWKKRWSKGSPSRPRSTYSSACVSCPCFGQTSRPANIPSSRPR